MPSWGSPATAWNDGQSHRLLHPLCVCGCVRASAHAGARMHVSIPISCSCACTVQCLTDLAEWTACHLAVKVGTTYVRQPACLPALFASFPPSSLPATFLPAVLATEKGSTVHPRLPRAVVAPVAALSTCLLLRPLRPDARPRSSARSVCWRADRHPRRAAAAAPSNATATNAAAVAAKHWWVLVRQPRWLVLCNGCSTAGGAHCWLLRPFHNRGPPPMWEQCSLAGSHASTLGAAAC